MLANDKHKQAGQNVFMSSIQGLANVMAFIAAFLLTPQAYGATVEWVVDYTARSYGIGFGDLTRMIWFCAMALFIFFASRATIGTALILGGLAIMTRFL